MKSITKKCLSIQINGFIIMVSTYHADKENPKMKNIEQTNKYLIKRFVDLENSITECLKSSDEDRKLHHFKIAKLNIELANQYGSEQTEIIRTYAFINELYFFDACKELYQYYKENKYGENNVIFGQ